MSSNQSYYKQQRTASDVKRLTIGDPSRSNSPTSHARHYLQIPKYVMLLNVGRQARGYSSDTDAIRSMDSMTTKETKDFRHCH